MKRILISTLVLLLGAACSAAVGEEAALRLPDGTVSIQAEAFAGADTIHEVILPDDITTIGSRAFADSSVSIINLPDSITDISDDAFEGCDGVTATVSYGSAGYEWCRANGIDYAPVPSPESDFSYTLSDGAATVTGYTGSASAVIVPDALGGYPVTHIAEKALYSSSIQEVYLPDGITDIHHRAIDSYYTDIYCRAGSATTEALTFVGRLYTDPSQPNYVLYGFGGSLDIKEYREKTVSEITLPASIRDCAVTEIATDAFAGMTGLRKVIIPEGYTSISYGAFDGCTSLSSVELPESLRSIGSDAFASCSSLTSISIPAGVYSVQGSAFSGCTRLSQIIVDEGSTYFKVEDGVLFSHDGKSLICYPAGRQGQSYVLPNTVETIDAGAFYAAKLTSVTLPTSLTTLGSGAFERAMIESIAIPQGVTTIPYDCFRDCAALESVSLPSGLKSIGSMAFYRCPSLAGFELPDSLATIASYALNTSCPGTSFTVPASVTSIGVQAFSTSCALTVHFGSHAETWCKDNNISYTIYSTPAQYFTYTTLWNAAGKDMYKITGYSGKDTNVVVPDQINGIPVGGIGDSAFKSASVTSVVLQSGVTSVSDNAFYGCAKLESIYLPEGITTIGDYAFYNCSSLKEITLPSTLILLDPYAMANCRSLTSVIIPGISTIPSMAFASCTSLERVVIENGVGRIDSNAFGGCSALTEIIIPDSVSAMGTSIFSGCVSLEEITIPAGMTSELHGPLIDATGLKNIRVAAGNTAFKSVDGVLFSYDGKTIIEYPDNRPDTHYTVPDGVTAIGYGAFDDLQNLTSLTIPGSVTLIDQFGICTNPKLTEINLSPGLETISSYGISECAVLTSLVIPEGTLTIDYNAFSYNPALTSVTIPESVTTIGYRIFSASPNVTAYVKSGSKAHTWCTSNSIPVKTS